MVAFKEDLVWETNQPITVDWMNFMAFNDIFVRNHYIECKLSNVNRDGADKERKWLVNHVSLFARTITITPGNDLKYDSVGNPYFSKTYNFPGNNFWESGYKPVVTLVLEGNKTFPMTIVLNSVHSETFTYTVYVLENRTISASREFKVNILAAGVKPISDNDLDTDTDPTP